MTTLREWECVICKYKDKYEYLFPYTTYNDLNYCSSRCLLEVKEDL